MSHPAVGTMTTEQARDSIEKMVDLIVEHRGAATRVDAVERAMDAVRQSAKNVTGRESHLRDYRLMWDTAREMRSEALTIAERPAPAGPEVAGLKTLEAQVPAGRYAVRGDDEKVRFYLVDCPAEGRWAGFTFVSQVTGMVGEDGTRVKHPEARARVLGAIVAAGIAESFALYGREIGRCGVCNRVLTDETSRAAGIGPICAAKL